MALQMSQMSTGSPKMTRRQTPSTNHGDEFHDNNKTPRNMTCGRESNSATPVMNQIANTPKPHAKTVEYANPASVNNVNNILAQLRINDSRKPGVAQPRQQDHLDRVIASLQNQHKTLKQQQMELNDDSESGSYKDPDRSSGSELFTPATETFEVEIHDPNHKPSQQSITEMNRIKRELETAKSVINRQELELAESRNLRHTMEQAMGPASEADFPIHSEAPRASVVLPHNGFNASARPFTSRTEPNWNTIDDGKADIATTLVNPSLGRGRHWNHNQIPLMSGTTVSYQGLNCGPHREVRANSFGYGSNHGPQVSPVEMNFPLNRTFSSGSSNVSFGIEDRMFGAGPYLSSRRPNNQGRTNSILSDPVSPVTPISPYGQTLVDHTGIGPITGGAQFGFLDRGFGGHVSHHPGQFPSGALQAFPADMNLTGNGINTSNYVMPAEPMNYRRLLDKSVSCDWKYIVDKIVCSNDQQASIFLQQKLKVGTAEQKYEIVESIVNQAYPLMINRFGNFLVQRCFEHGTPEQVVAIANAIHGNVISLSMDPFGCHVIQKAFDSVPEDHKADMVRELLRRIPDTVIHRYACHVWQKLFELRWSGEPPQIMVKVNEALQGMWHEVALGETGSLVVQNIFENCVEEEKRPAIEEVISSIDLIAHGQFGNWCIQHLCEHGSPPDKRRVIDHILKNSYNYSIDQFASKVVEKCLKIGGPEFLKHYLGVITTAQSDRTRIPLIDIAGDQYGNYLIQWILMNTHPDQREQVANHIRKHMVSLRGSKFGSRVAMLCSNPASVTRPGAATSLVNPYGAPTQQRMGNRYR